MAMGDFPYMAIGFKTLVKADPVPPPNAPSYLR